MEAIGYLLLPGVGLDFISNLAFDSFSMRYIYYVHKITLYGQRVRTALNFIMNNLSCNTHKRIITMNIVMKRSVNSQ